MPTCTPVCVPDCVLACTLDCVAPEGTKLVKVAGISVTLVVAGAVDVPGGLLLVVGGLLPPDTGNVLLLPYTIPSMLQAASPAVGLDSQQNALVLTPTGGTPARLLLQFPGWPTPPEHRMMILLESDPLEQYAPFAMAQVNFPVLESLKYYPSKSGRILIVALQKSYARTR